LTLNVALTTVLRTNVLHCDSETVNILQSSLKPSQCDQRSCRLSSVSDRSFSNHRCSYMECSAAPCRIHTICQFSVATSSRPLSYRAMHFSAKRGIAIACRLSVCLSVCPSVTLVNCDHIGWNSSKIISPLVSAGRSLFATPT